MSLSTTQGFRGEYFFLSNFYPAPVTIDYHDNTFVFATNEHVFQGMKIAATLSDDDKHVSILRKLENNTDPKSAKYWGRKIRIDVNKWNAISEVCMKRALYLKFSQHPVLMEKLVSTGDTELIEYNSWGGTLWGVDKNTGTGKNTLGILLMELRTRNGINT